MRGIVTAAMYITVGMIAKAALEAGYFKDRRAAGKTVRIWLVSFGTLCLALCFALLIDHAG